MKFSIWKLLLIAILIIMSGVAFQGYKIYNYMLDFKAVSEMANSPGRSGKPKRKPHVNFIQEFVSEDRQSFMLSDYVSSPFGTYGASMVSDEKMAEAIEKIPSDYFENLENNLSQRLHEEISNISPPAPAPATIDISAPMPNLREVRTTARLMYIAGRKASIEQKGELAIETMISVILFSQLFENSFDEGLPLIGKMIGIAVRKIGAAGLIEVSPRHVFSPEKTRFWVKKLVEIEKNIPSMALAFKYERQMIPSVFDPQKLEKYRKEANGKRVPAHLIHALGNPQLQNKFIDPIFAPMIEACSLPYQQAISQLYDVERELENILKHVSKPSLDWSTYLFFPEHYVLQLLLGMTVPNSRRALRQDFAAKQTLRGGIAVLALFNCAKNNNKMPASLAEIEKWLGEKLPEDVYTDAVLQYRPGTKKVLFSVGPDGKADTEDDMVFVPLRNPDKK